MSEIGRNHFLVATYENMSLNATPTLLGKYDYLKVLTYLITRSYDHWLVTGCQTEIQKTKLSRKA